MQEKKLIIKAQSEKEDEIIIRISRKSNALLDDIAKKSGRGKNYIASRMIEFAYDFVEIDNGSKVNSKD